jgi:protein tyrosine phosphatase (PTP) superfamily phosphohydrolase (DUF442 family)
MEARMRVPSCVFSLVLLTVAAAPFAAGQGQVVREEIPGIRNFAQIESTVACAGAITPESVTGIREMGFRSIVNLRMATEQGANVEAEAAAAREAGINYVHLPFNGQAPDRAVVDRFIDAMSEEGNQPAFVHCAAAMWLAKRLVIDAWDTDRAMREATALGLSSEPLGAFILDYAAAR